MPLYTTLPLSQHVLDALPVRFLDLLLQLVFSKPLEVLETKRVLLQVDLASHDTRFQEERLCAMFCEAGGKLGGFGVVVLVVADGYVADEPGVRVGAAGLSENAGSCLA